MPRFASALATLALVGSLCAGALAQSAPRTVVRGSIVSIDGNVVTVKSPTSTYKVTLADDARVTYVVKSDISKINAGMFIGTAAVPQRDGTYRALEIQLFDQAAHPGETDRPWDVAPSSTMTNSTIITMSPTTFDKVNGRMIVFKVKDGEKRVFVPANAPVVEFEKADRSALVPGASVLTFAVKKDDGTLTAPSISVGKAGLVIPY